MELEWDEPKRVATLRERSLDFADANTVFDGEVYELEDDRFDYGETRYQTIGRLQNEIIMVVWTPREDRRRIISMRVCDESERRRYTAALARRR
jgi:uncharacterized DUF497 family protein